MKRFIRFFPFFLLVLYSACLHPEYDPFEDIDNAGGKLIVTSENGKMTGSEFSDSSATPITLKATLFLPRMIDSGFLTLRHEEYSCDTILDALFKNKKDDKDHLSAETTLVFSGGGAYTVLLTTYLENGSTSTDSIRLNIIHKPIPLVITSEDDSLQLTYTDSSCSYITVVNNNQKTVNFSSTSVTNITNVSVNGKECSSEKKEHSCSLKVGENAIIISSILDSDSTSIDYTVMITREPSDIATLETIYYTDSTSDVNFDPDNDSGYIIEVEYQVDIPTITAIPSHPGATVTLGDSLKSISPEIDSSEETRSYAFAIPLTVGDNPVLFVVTAEDTVTAKVYEVTIRRKRNNNAMLSSIHLSEGSLDPEFHPDSVHYHVILSNQIAAITVTPVLSDSNASARIDDDDPPKTFTLKIGLDSATINVLAQDSLTKKSYVVVFERLKSDDATLRECIPTAGTLNPTFDRNVEEYTLTIADSITTIGFTVTPYNEHATVQINGGSSDSTFTLEAQGETEIDIVVTAEENSSKKTYTIIVKHRDRNSDATLTAIQLSEGSLDPAFHPDTLQYRIILSYDDSSVTITPVTSDSNATVTVDDAAAQQKVDMAVGLDSVTIHVLAEDAITEKEYVLIFNRLASSDATLKECTPTAGALNPAFDRIIEEYTISVADSIDSISFYVTPFNNLATVEINGTSPDSTFALTPMSDTKITIVVTAADSSTIKTYVISVRRSGGTNASLSDITFSCGYLVPEFQEDTLGYELRIPSDSGTVRVMPDAVHSRATVTVNGNSVTTGEYSPSVTAAQGYGSGITVAVTSETGTQHKTYNITVNRAFKLTVAGDGNGSTDPEGTMDAFAGVPLSLSASSGNGYYFSQWTTTGNAAVAASDDSSTTVQVTGDGSVTANFAIKRYRLTLSTNGYGNTNGPDSVDHLDQVTITAIPKACHPFIRWETTDNALIDNTNTSETTVRLTGDATVTAIFVSSLDTIYVDSSSQGDATGLDWTNAFTDLQDALSCATDGTIILVAKGTYYPHATDRDVSFVLENGVRLYGGYSTGGVGRDVDANPTILSGEIHQDGDSTNNSFTIVEMQNVDNSCVLDGVTIAGGYGSNTGGGLMVVDGSPVIEGCRFTGNCSGTEETSVTCYGGAIFFQNSSSMINNCEFSNNSCVSQDTCRGGAVYSSGGQLQFYNCFFIDNKAGLQNSNTTYTCGGAIHIFSGTLTNCMFSNNHIMSRISFGGAIYLEEGSITDCSFWDNRCSAIEATGGAAYLTYATLTDCIFTGNGIISYYSRGGAAFCTHDTLINCQFSMNSSSSEDISATGGALVSSDNIFINCSFSDNNSSSESSSGGGMSSTHDMIINCSFSGNSCNSVRGFGSGGALEANYDTLINCTFTRNKSLGRDGGSGGAADLNSSVITNSIFWDDTSVETTYDSTTISEISGSSNTLRNCIIQGGYTGTGTTDSIFTDDPFLGELDTITGPVPFFPIPSNSPARDRGTADVPNGVDISTDARGYARDNQPDIGAYEVQ